MAYIDNLSLEAQSLIMVNFEMFAKMFILLFAFTFAVLYYFYWSKNQEKTPYFMLASLRFMLKIVSGVFIWSFPLMIFLIYPQVIPDYIYNFMIVFYSIGLLAFTLFFFVNFFYFFPMGIIRMGGWDADDGRTDQVLKKVFQKDFKRIFAHKVTVSKIK